MPVMIQDGLRKLKTGPSDLRKFGLLVGGVFCLLTLWGAWRGKPLAFYFLIPAVPLIVLGLAWPRSLREIYIAWMTIGLVLGLIVSTSVLTVCFYLVVTPVGLIARLCGKDFLNRRLDRSAPSYWLARRAANARGRERYEQQF
jgi:hypothetical protein